MIVSDEHRYVFIEQPHTGCTAIREELLQFYGGRPMLDRHATYAAFLRVATPEQQRYFVFSGIRNPLDERVSMYFKYRTDHRRKYSRRFARMDERQRQAYEAIAHDRADFVDYLLRFHRRPYDNDTLIHHAEMDDLIRFEHLQEDFGRVLERLGLRQVRPVPAVNRTAERGEYLDYYPPEVRAHAVRVFGPYMRKWGYELPGEWGDVSVPPAWTLAFRLLGVFRYVYRRYVHVGQLYKRRRPSNPVARAFAPVTDPIARRLRRVFGP